MPPSPDRSSLPSAEEVAAFVASAPGKVGKREIARAFGVGTADKAGLKDLVRGLERDGVLARRGRRVRAAAALPSVLVAVVTGRDRDGELVAEPAEWDEADGARPRIVLSAPRATGRARVPGVGDRALVKLGSRTDETGAYPGRIMKVLGREGASAIGVFKASPDGGGRLLPVDKKAMGRELVVRPGDVGPATDGDLVLATVRPGRGYGSAEATVRDRLGSVASEKAISLVALHAHGIPHVFPPPVLAEAERAKPAGLEGREDWRDLPLVTIDPPDAKDHDDAVWAAPDPDPANPGGHVVAVAIADVAHYVRTGGALDREAETRGNSVYFPDRVVPMLPERISNDLCSLRPGEARAALALRMVFTAEGKKLRHSLHRVLMRSAAKLSYAQAQAAIDGRPDDAAGPLLDGVLRPLWAAYGALAKARDLRGPLALDLPERKVLLKPDGTVDRVVTPERLEAHRLIEEFMIAANVAAAEIAEKARTPLVYRVHDEPSLEKMRALGEVLVSVGLKAPKAGALRPGLFNGILRQVAGGRHEIFVNEVVLRSQAQAEYAAENYGHFGLNLRRYAHFTSPIRRYADLVVHRALIRAAGLGADGLSPETTGADLAKVAEDISKAERRAMAAERETVDRLIAFHLADQVGASFEGRISGVVRSGLFVKLAGTGADGFVPAATIGADYYRHDEKRQALVGARTGETYRLGDAVTVRLVEAAPFAGALRFELLSDADERGRARPSREPGRGGRARLVERRSARRKG